MNGPVPEITATELGRQLEQGTPLQVLDIRAPQRLTASAIEVRAPARFHNVPGSRLVATDDPRGEGLDPALPVTVVCGHGNSSKPIANWLIARGYDARSLRGGMAAWANLLMPRRIAAPPGFDTIVQFDRLAKGALGYLLVSGGEAIIVDPPRAADPFLEELTRCDARLVGVADTHVHADYLSGGPALAARFGVAYYLHPADAVYPYDGTPGRLTFTALADGARIPVGRTALTVVHTPGHTEGSVTFMTDDALALTGDFLFVHSIGRPDLAGKTAAWTDDLWRSLERVRGAWDDSVVIAPAHYASEAERRPDRTVTAAWGDLRRTNEPLTLTHADRFRAWIAERAREAPATYRTIKAANVGLRTVDDAEAELLEVGKNECAIG